jgi:hypothetical protein
MVEPVGGNRRQKQGHIIKPTPFMRFGGAERVFVRAKKSPDAGSGHEPPIEGRGDNCQRGRTPGDEIETVCGLDFIQWL